MADYRLKPHPVCPHCGCVHRDAWEWSFGPCGDGSMEHDCDRCGESFIVERVVTVEYNTKAKEADRG